MQTEATIEANGDGCWFCDAVERTHAIQSDHAYQFYALVSVNAREAATAPDGSMAVRDQSPENYFWSPPAARHWVRLLEAGVVYAAMILVPLGIIVPMIGFETALILGQIALAVGAAYVTGRWLLLQWRIWRSPILNDMQAAIAYVGPWFEGATTERAVIVGIGHNHGIVFEHVIHGDRNSVQVDIRDLLAHALRADAIVLLLFHNHPGAPDARPSSADNRFTRRFSRACRAVGLHVVDHVIFGGDLHYSYRLDEEMAGL